MSILLKSGGVCIVGKDNEEVQIDISYIKSDMKAEIKATRRPNSYYVKLVREMIKDLDSSGLRAVPQVQNKLRSILGLPEIKGFTIGGTNNPSVDFKSSVENSKDDKFLGEVFEMKVNKSYPKKNQEEKHYGFITELASRSLFKKWEQFLGMIKQCSNSQKKLDDSTKKYEENFEKIFNNP